ncbi:MAG: hypothetical protein KatS3mg024_0452 [Armatimonadota bacterium]|nr:MAG: hypothetical protein KatS3mg024_0452 [Armatimonadota bacterium]
MERVTRSPDETESFGRELASRLQPGDVVLLEGGLGAGKTVVVRGIVRGLDSTDHVSSPTFVLVHEYRGRFPVAHADLYRLSGHCGSGGPGFGRVPGRQFRGAC